MDDAKYPLPDLDGTVSEIAAILAKGWLRLSASRRAVSPSGEMPDAENTEPLSEKGLDYSGPRSPSARTLTPGERRRKGG
jgi:hypothetical protein